MSRKRRKTETSSKSGPAKKWIVQAGIIAVVAVLVVAVLILKDQAADPPAPTEEAAPATATLPEATGQARATTELAPVHSQPTATIPGVQAAALPGELPEAQLERLLAAGQPTLAFFHSNNCVQCIKMMDVVDQVYPEFTDSVALVDVNVYDKANASLLQRARIRAIPTQIFFEPTGQGLVVMGAMTPDQFRERMQALAGGQ